MKFCWIFAFWIVGQCAFAGGGAPTVGSWTYHYSPNTYYHLMPVGSDLYADGRYALYRYAQNHEIDVLDKPKGLSEYAISTLNYSDSDQTMIVAYDNTTLDILSFVGGKRMVTPNYDLYNKLYIGQKNIDEIKFFDHRAYLSTTLGLIIFNFTENIIESTCVLGDSGKSSEVKSVERFQGSWYAISDRSIKSALDNQSINLQNYQNWNTIAKMNGDSFFSLLAGNGVLYLMSAHTLASWDGSNLTTLKSLDSLNNFTKMRAFNGEVYVLQKTFDTSKNLQYSTIFKISGNNLITIQQNSLNINDFVLQNGDWYATAQSIFKINGNDLTEYKYHTAPSNAVYHLQYQNGNFYVNTGVLLDNLDTRNNWSGYYQLNGSEWSYTGNWSKGYGENTQNQMNVVERSDGFWRCYSKGCVTRENPDGTATLFDSTNSTLQHTLGHNNVINMEIDPISQTIWIVANGNDVILKSVDIHGKWRQHPISKVSTDDRIRKVFIDGTGNKWLLTFQNGVILFNEQDIDNPNDDIFQHITQVKDGDCSMDPTRTYTIVEDKNQVIWIGAQKGIAAISDCNYDPTLPCVFSIPGQTIHNPKNPLDSTYECAFLNTSVDALFVDGGNRMWVGAGGNIFYVESGFVDKYQGISSEYLRLSDANSPFPGKSIYDIRVHPVSGQVFVSTEIGLVSYEGYSTEGISNFSKNVLTTPNPVPRDYTGLISIDGFPTDATFKITDVVGNLVYQGVANGGRVVWDGRDLTGKRPPTGVYFVFATQNGIKTNSLSRIGSFTMIE